MARSQNRIFELAIGMILLAHAAIGWTMASPRGVILPEIILAIAMLARWFYVAGIAEGLGGAVVIVSLYAGFYAKSSASMSSSWATSVVLAAVGSALYVAGSRERWVRWAFFVAAAISIIIGGVSFGVAFLGLEGWASPSDGVVWCIIGILLGFAARNGVRDKVSALWIPVAFGVGLGTLLIWRLSVSHEQERYESISTTVRLATEERWTRWIQEHQFDLERMAARWQLRNDFAMEEWKSDAENHRSDAPEISYFALIDPNHQVVSCVPQGRCPEQIQNHGRMWVAFDSEGPGLAFYMPLDRVDMAAISQLINIPATIRYIEGKDSTIVGLDLDGTSIFRATGRSLEGTQAISTKFLDRPAIIYIEAMAPNLDWPIGLTFASILIGGLFIATLRRVEEAELQTEAAKQQMRNADAVAKSLSVEKQEIEQIAWVISKDSLVPLSRIRDLHPWKGVFTEPFGIAIDRLLEEADKFQIRFEGLQHYLEADRWRGRTEMISWRSWFESMVSEVMPGISVTVEGPDNSLADPIALHKIFVELFRSPSRHENQDFALNIRVTDTPKDLRFLIEGLGGAHYPKLNDWIRPLAEEEISELGLWVARRAIQSAGGRFEFFMEQERLRIAFIWPKLRGPSAKAE